jgi:mannose-6-phosphate isomerase-like protein (cupin superfamily)
MRLQNALIAWSDAGSDAVIRHDEPHEIVVVLPDAGAVLSAGPVEVEAPKRSISILPAGPSSIALTTAGRVIRVFSPFPETLACLAANAEDYATARPRVKPLGSAMVYGGEPGIRVYDIERCKAIAGRQPPSFQTGSMNVMWIERDGPSDRTKLDPHSHDDFEEGALVVAGEYVEHLRTPWAADASAWHEDEHVMCKPGTLIIVPPTVIHTTETRGPGPHLMLNIFAPARADHINSGMVLNAKDYAPA